MILAFLWQFILVKLRDRFFFVCLLVLGDHFYVFICANGILWLDKCILLVLDQQGYLIQRYR